MSRHQNISAFESASNLLMALRNKTISSQELIDFSISRIEERDKEINAVVVKDYERAREAAKTADLDLAKGDQRPLLGLPITVKESFNVKGLSTTWGNVSFQHWMPQEDAATIARLKSAGAIILGKTNVPCMLSDWQTYNPIYGTTNNPWDLRLTPGGSSGGSAAALAMGYVSLELGSDLAGSLRIPAHFCGVAAHKPSADLVPLRGASPPTTLASTRKIDFAVAGPMARTVQDLMLSLNVLAGPDELSDGMGYQLKLPLTTKTSLQEFRVLMIDQHPLYPTAKSLTALYEEVYQQLKQTGVPITKTSVQLPDLGEIARLFALLLGAWFSEVMSKESYNKTVECAKSLASTDKSLANQFLRGLTITHRDWLLALRERERLNNQWNKLYEDFDVILTPVTPTLAFPHDQSKDPELRNLIINGIKVPYAHQYIWVCIANLFGLPTTTFPVGVTKDLLPVGIQVIGRYLHDDITLKFSQLLEKLRGGFSAPPRACV